VPGGAIQVKALILQTHQPNAAASSLFGSPLLLRVLQWGLLLLLVGQSESVPRYAEHWLMLVIQLSFIIGVRERPQQNYLKS
jgi:hypothetical protein